MLGKHEWRRRIRQLPTNTDPDHPTQRGGVEQFMDVIMEREQTLSIDKAPTQSHPPPPPPHLATRRELLDHQRMVGLDDPSGGQGGKPEDAI